MTRTSRPMTIREVSERLRVPESTLRYWRHTGTGGPVSFKIGRRVVYDELDVEAYIARQRDGVPAA